MRAPKAAIDQVMHRIEIELGLLRDRQRKTILATRRDSNAALIHKAQHLQRELNAAEDALEKAGLRMDHRGVIGLAVFAADEIEKHTHAIRRRFETMRQAMIVRYPIANAEEKEFLIRNFYTEAVKEFPALQSLIGTKGKVTP